MTPPGAGPQAIRVEKLPPGPRSARRFLAVSHAILGKDPHWVAPMLSDALQVLSPANPFFEHASMEFWVATRDGREVGRIAGVVDRQYQERWESDTGFFGFLEVVDDPAVARALFGAVEAWARERGIARLLGPMNPSAKDECGLLVRGFDTDPTILMPYNPEYYERLVLGAGYGVAKDLLAFRIEVAGMPAERLERVSARYRARHSGLVLRPVLKRDLRDLLPLIRTIYNEGWDDNWGFVPIHEVELDFMAGRLIPMLTEGLVWVALWDGEPAGVLVTLLDFNQALKPLRGRLLGPGLLKALPYLVGWRRPDTARVLMLGVRQQFRRKGIEAMLLLEGLQVARKLGVVSAEASWILDDNEPVIRTITAQGGEVSKVYRLYDRRIAP